MTPDQVPSQPWPKRQRPRDGDPAAPAPPVVPSAPAARSPAPHARPPGPPPGPDLWRRPIVVASAVAAILLIVALGLATQSGPLEGGQPAAHAVSTSAGLTGEPADSPSDHESDPGSASPEVSANEGDSALEELRSIRAADRERLGPDGRWIAQLGSKYPGMRVEGERSPSGDHVFTADEILALHQALVERFGDYVLLTLSTDFGKRQKFEGQALWVTIADVGFTTEQEGDTWCADAFPDLSGAALKDECFVRPLKPD